MTTTDQSWKSTETTKLTRKLTNSWKLNNSLLSEKLVKTEVEKEIKDFLEYNENKFTIYPKLWYTMKAILAGSVIALTA